MSGIGARILERTANTVSADTIAALQTLGVAQVSDCMARLYGTRDLKCIHTSNLRMAGIAITVKVRAGDNLFIHEAIKRSTPGDVIVVDGAGVCSNALVGELMMLASIAKGVVGFVIDGAVRDADAFSKHNFPCFARDIAHRGPFKDGPGEINVPVSVGGMVVCAGDVVIGDVDGVLAIPVSHVDEVLKKALKKEQAEQIAMEKIAAGNYEKPWLAPAIEQNIETYK